MIYEVLWCKLSTLYHELKCNRFEKQLIVYWLALYCSKLRIKKSVTHLYINML